MVLFPILYIMRTLTRDILYVYSDKYGIYTVILRDFSAFMYNSEVNRIVRVNQVWKH